MSAGARLLCPVGLCNAEGVSQGRYAGLQVELRRLGQVCLLAKVVEIEEGGPTLHLSLHQGGRSDLQTDQQQRQRLEFPRFHLLLLQTSHFLIY